MSLIKKMKKVIFDKEDIKSALNFISYIIFFGILINFSLYYIFGIKFDYFSWLAWGILLWVIEKKAVNILRNIFIR